MGANSFHRLADEAETEVGLVLASLPDELRKQAGDLPVVFQLKPDPEILNLGESPDDLLGLFVGEPMDDEGGYGIPLPPQIFLFLANIWDFAGGDPREFRRELRKTYLHELGHYLGLGEGDLEARGMD